MKIKKKQKYVACNILILYFNKGILQIFRPKIFLVSCIVTIQARKKKLVCETMNFPVEGSRL